LTCFFLLESTQKKIVAGATILLHKVFGSRKPPKYRKIALRIVCDSNRTLISCCQISPLPRAVFGTAPLLPGLAFGKSAIDQATDDAMHLYQYINTIS